MCLMHIFLSFVSLRLYTILGFNIRHWQFDPRGSASVFGRFPYGQNLYRHATGRCSNGLLIIDFIAKSAGIPLPNAYLNANSTKTHGVNFAVAGSTALPVEFLAENGVIAPVTNSSLTIQLKWMGRHFNTTCHNSKKISFMVGEIGGNDYNYAFFQGKTIDELTNIVKNVVKTIKEVVMRLLDLVLLELLFLEIFLLVACPYILLDSTNDSTAYDEFHCLKELNNFSMYHNLHLQQAIKELQEKYPHVTIVWRLL
ncbi:hypothetical protein GH714_029571 [Hevea brasiliensis]|uniref:Acetylajmalan esterase-like n=1 Tax=Hevea brasiliensis TaxID=3981 RepID=A0A6A6LEJ2_HEVBR|nr:hypothetical protein GH714_029571 [Hevea brasiliensis]